MIRSLSCLFICSFAFACSAAPALDTSQLLGHALHLFNQGNYAAAYPHFSTLIGEQMIDPRAYYYRGLCAWQMGAREAAEDDFRAGAALEMKHPDPLGMTPIQMYRIQGRARLALERQRTSARLAAFERREKERQALISGAEPTP